ncbi:MAG: hypothetical protein ABSB31_05590 [Dehalococcoidia bacterium]
MKSIHNGEMGWHITTYNGSPLSQRANLPFKTSMVDYLFSLTYVELKQDDKNEYEHRFWDGDSNRDFHISFLPSARRTRAKCHP